MKRIPRARCSRAGPVVDRETWAKPPGAKGVGDFFGDQLLWIFRRSAHIIFKVYEIALETEFPRWNFRD